MVKTKSINNYEENMVEDLFISSKFPPNNDISGIVLSKRIINLNKKVDVLCANIEGDTDLQITKLINQYIHKKMMINLDFVPNTQNSIIQFIKKGYEEIEKNGTEYKTITSRAWTIDSHFMALYYKIKHPNVKWVGEFSDPLSINTNNKVRKAIKLNLIPDEYFNILNKNIDIINVKYSKNFSKVSKEDNVYYLCEYLTFLFADKILFTNKNQRRIMLTNLSDELKEFVLLKSEIKPHPILPKKYYNIEKSNYSLDPEYIHFGYFGTYLGKRHLETLFYAFELLDDSILNKIKIHMFVPDSKLINANLINLKIYNSIEIGNKIPLLEFLNLLTKFDVLLVNDLITKDTFEINPYLPSKLSDYLGSGTDIWAIIERGSILSQTSIKYKSFVDDYPSAYNELIKILSDKKLIENDPTPINYNFFENRITDLNNHIYELNIRLIFLERRINNYKKRVNSLKKENEMINYKNRKKIIQYEQLLKKSENKFKKINNLDETISLKNIEISYYRNRIKFLDKIFLSPLSYLYLLLFSSAECFINIKLYYAIRHSNWFNRGYYIKYNKDVSTFKWMKIFSPELHFVCHGFNEKRNIENMNVYKNNKIQLIQNLKIKKNKLY